LFGQYEDSFQEAWVEILERNPQIIHEIGPIAKRVRNRAIKQYLEKKFKEESLNKPLGNNGDDTFTLESILASPINENNNDRGNGNEGLYGKMVDFLIGEYVKQRNENIELKRKEIQLKTERLRLREELLRFKKDRFESWSKLMEEKGREKERRLMLTIQFQREKLEFQKERLLLSEKQTDG